MQLINWLVEQLEPLSKDLVYKFQLRIKSCYACKINPKIPDGYSIHFKVDPDTGTQV